MDLSYFYENEVIYRVIPLLLALIWFAGSGMLSRIGTERQMDTIGQLTTLARSTGDVVHQLQRERGMSAGFIGARGQQFRDEILVQRKLTDDALVKLNQALARTDTNLIQGNAATLKMFKDNIQSLDATRNAISALNIEASKSTQFYTQTISGLLSFVGGIGQLSASGPMVNELAAFYSLLNLKEQAGIERALLTNVFSVDRFSDGQFRMLSDVVGKQEAWLTATRRFSSEAQAAELDKALASAEVTRALELRTIALNKAQEGGFGVKPTDWFTAQTKRIEILRQETQAADALLAHSAALAHNARVDWQSFLAISLIALLIAIAFAMMVVRSIQQQLTNTLKTINEMDGDLTRRLDVPGSDELSALNRAYNQAIENIQHIVQEIKSGALILSNASSDITDGNQDLAQRTDEQAASIVETAASMEQISTAISQTAHNASEAERLTQSMANDVMDATRVSNEASQSMAAIRSSSDNIFQIVASIDEISFQTNLLALNAAVEAARAGNWAKVSPLWRQRCVISPNAVPEASLIRELVNQNMDNIGEGGNGFRRPRRH
jgi:methyl-accepting chemotaxis protein